MIRLAAGFVLMGLAGTALLRGQRLRLRVLSAPLCALCGQVVLWAYFLLRSALSRGLGLPGVGSAELVLAALIFGAWGLGWEKIRGLRLESLMRRAIPTAAWLVPFISIFAIKISLLAPASSDPDVQAYYAKVFAQAGSYMSSMPGSDVPIVYTGGFPALNALWMLLTGLGCVQVVNVQIYLQLALFAGSVMALAWNRVPARLIRAFPTGTALWLAGQAALAAFALSPLFLPDRSYMEGAPRLAHTGLLFLPAFLLMGARPKGRSASWILAAGVGAATALSLTFNPAHIPLALLMAGVAYAFFRASPRRSMAQDVFRIGLAALACLVLLAFLDPYFSLARGNLAIPVGHIGQLNEGRDASRLIIIPGWSLKSFFADFLSLGTSLELWFGPGLTGATALLVLAALGLRWAGLGPWRGAEVFSRGPGTLIPAAGAALLVLFLHLVLTTFIAAAVTPAFLTGTILRQYSSAAQTHASLLCLSALLIALLSPDQLLLGRPRPVTRMVPFILLTIVLGSSLYLSWRKMQFFTPILGRTSMGEISPEAIQAARWLEKAAQPEERILLTGHTFRTGFEFWMFPTGGSRAFALYSRVRTSFFYGLDGRAFTPEAYHERFESGASRPDIAWLCANRIAWAYSDGESELPGPLQNAGLGEAWRAGGARLWRLPCPG